MSLNLARRFEHGLFGFLIMLQVLVVGGCWMVNVPETSSPSLFKVNGKAMIENDSVFSQQRLLQITNPKVLLVWRFIGYTEQEFHKPSGVVSLKFPYQFTVDLESFPEGEVVNGLEPCIGDFVLFSDVNGNDQTDDLTHPLHQLMLDTLKKKRSSYLDVYRSWKYLGVRHEDPVNTKDVYELDTEGVLFYLPEGEKIKITTVEDLGVSIEKADSLLNHILDGWMYALYDSDKWEQFFLFRQRDILPARIDYQKIRDHGVYSRYTLMYQRRIFPRQEWKKQWYAITPLLMQKYFDMAMYFQKVSAIATKKHWDDYSFENGGSKDWVFGWSSWDHLLYVHDNLSLFKLKKAERTSGFIVDHPEELKIGFNLIHCDINYHCEIRNNQPSVDLRLGTKAVHFNEPIPTRIMPIDSVNVYNFSTWNSDNPEGLFELSPFSEISVWKAAGGIWLYYPANGAFFLKKNTQPFYASTYTFAQIGVFPASKEFDTKLILYLKNKTLPAKKINSTLPDSFSVVKNEISVRTFSSNTRNIVEKYLGVYKCKTAIDSVLIFKGANASVQVKTSIVWAFTPQWETTSNMWGHPEIGDLFTIDTSEVVPKIIWKNFGVKPKVYTKVP